MSFGTGVVSLLVIVAVAKAVFWALTRRRAWLRTQRGIRVPGLIAVIAALAFVSAVGDFSDTFSYAVSHEAVTVPTSWDATLVVGPSDADLAGPEGGPPGIDVGSPPGVDPSTVTDDEPEISSQRRELETWIAAFASGKRKGDDRTRPTISEIDALVRVRDVPLLTRLSAVSGRLLADLIVALTAVVGFIVARRARDGRPFADGSARLLSVLGWALLVSIPAAQWLTSKGHEWVLRSADWNEAFTASSMTPADVPLLLAPGLLVLGLVEVFRRGESLEEETAATV